LVTVPNGNYAIIPVSIAINYRYSTAAYTLGSGNVVIGYAGDNADLSGTVTITATANKVYTHATSGIAGTESDVKGKNLVLRSTLANPAAGSGTFNIYITYRLINLDLK
jgi:hypothetical protein